MRGKDRAALDTRPIWRAVLAGEGQASHRTEVGRARRAAHLSGLRSWRQWMRATPRTRPFQRGRFGSIGRLYLLCYVSHVTTGFHFDFRRWILERAHFPPATIRFLFSPLSNFRLVWSWPMLPAARLPG